MIWYMNTQLARTLLQNMCYNAGNYSDGFGQKRSAPDSLAKAKGATESYHEDVRKTKQDERKGKEEAERRTEEKVEEEKRKSEAEERRKTEDEQKEREPKKREEEKDKSTNGISALAVLVRSKTAILCTKSISHTRILFCIITEYQ